MLVVAADCFFHYFVPPLGREGSLHHVVNLILNKL